MARLKVGGTSHEKIVILTGLKGSGCALPWGEATGSVEKSRGQGRKYWQELLLWFPKKGEGEAG